MPLRRLSLLLALAPLLAIGLIAAVLAMRLAPGDHEGWNRAQVERPAPA
jgi:hypothetical protein